MTKFEYLGAIENINESQTKLVEEVLEKRGFKNAKVEINAVGEAGDNNVANVKRITIKDTKMKSFKMIAKIAPSVNQTRINFHIHDVFSNEIVIYTEILPKFRQLQFEAKVPDNDLLKFAEHYGSLSDAPNEILLLEDLEENNFKVLDKFKTLSNECIRSVLKNVAILH